MKSRMLAIWQKLGYLKSRMKNILTVWLNDSECLFVDSSNDSTFHFDATAVELIVSVSLTQRT